MKRIRETLIFIIIFLIILFINFLFYKNIDIFLRINEKEVYSYESDLKSDKKDFLIELYEQIEKQNENELIKDEEIENISKNKLIYRVIKNNILKNMADEEVKEIIAKNIYTKELSNTIYGELMIIDNLYEYDNKDEINNFAIIYSKDMTKLCYLDKNEVPNSILNKEYIKEIKEAELWSFGEEIDDKKSKTEILDSCKNAFSSFIQESDFTPDTITYKGNYYILKDISNDITVYYNVNYNVILGFYIGFEK